MKKEIRHIIKLVRNHRALQDKAYEKEKEILAYIKENFGIDLVCTYYRAEGLSFALRNEPLADDCTVPFVSIIAGLERKEIMNYEWFDKRAIY